MKNLKSIIYLALFALALVAVNYKVYFRSESESSVKASGDVLIGVDPAEVRALTIERGSTMTLERTLDGWRFRRPFTGSADDQTVAKLLDALRFKPVDEVMTDGELLKLGHTRAEFSLDIPRATVTVERNDGKVSTVVFGALTPKGDGAYASVNGRPEVYVVPKSTYDAACVGTEGFRRHRLFRTDAGAIGGFDIRRSAGSLLEFVRDGDGWKTQSGAASKQKIRDFLTALMSAEAKSFVWPTGASNETEHAGSALLSGYGLDPESAITVTLKGVNDDERQISFGKSAGDGLAYALVQNGNAIVTIDSPVRDMAAQDAVMFTDTRLFQLEARAVSGYTIATADGIAYTLAIGSDGAWMLESPVVAPADQAVAKSLLARMLALTPVDVASDDFITVSVTTNAPSMKVARASVMGSLTFEQLRSRDIMNLDGELVRRIVRTAGREGAKAESVTYARDRKIWDVEQGADNVEADQKGIARVLTAVCSLKAKRVVKLKVSASDLTAYGLDNPEFKVAVDLSGDDAMRRNILIGKRTEDGFYVTVGASDAVFLVSDRAVAELSAQIVRK